MKKLCTMLVIAIMLLAALPTAIMPAGAAGPQKTQLTIYAPDSVHCLQTFDVSGQLLAGTSPVGVDGMKITVYRSTNGKKWTQLGTSVTSGGGYYKVSTSESTAGTYYYKASYTGGKLYASVQSKKVTTTVAVDPVKHTTLALTASGTSLYVGEELQVSACLKDGAGTPLQGQPITIDFTCDQGQHFTLQGTTDATGYCNPGCCMDIAGKYSIVATYAGDASYASATSNSVLMEVKEKPLTATTLTLDQPNWAYAGEPMTFTGTLTAADNSVMYGKDIRIQVYNPDTRQWDELAATATSGTGAFIASAVIGTSGIYQVQAVYDGGDGYAGDTSGPCNVEVKFNPGTTLDFGISQSEFTHDGTFLITWTATLKDSSGQTLPGQLIEVEIADSVTGEWSHLISSAYTDESGVAINTYGHIIEGYYKVRAVFTSTSTYEGSTSNEATYEVDITSTTLDLTVSPNPAIRGEPITFSGKLVDANNEGIPDMNILLRFSDSSGTIFSQSVVTGLSGEYQYITPFDAMSSFNVQAYFSSWYKYRGTTSEEVSFIVNPPPVTQLATPTLISPADGTIYQNIYPRTTTLTWGPVPGATSYQVEIQFYMPEIGKWYTDTTPVTVTGNSYTFDFVGDQPGRWRVTALDSNGVFESSNPSAWSGFEYTWDHTTTLTITIDPPTPYVGDFYEVRGKLTDVNGAGIPDKTIKIQVYDSAQQMWIDSGIPFQTDGSGECIGYGFASSPGSDKYRLVFESDVNYYSDAISNEVTMEVALKPTKLSVTAVPNPVGVEQTCTITATLTDVNDVPVPGATIIFQYYPPGGSDWVTVLAGTTDGSGTYSHESYFIDPGSMMFRALFLEDSWYGGSSAEFQIVAE